TLQRRRVRVLIVIADEDDGYLPDRRHVNAFVPIAAARGSITEEAKGNAILTAHLHGEANSCGDRNVVAKHADKGDQGFRQFTHVDVSFFAARGTGLARHILREDGAQRHSANEESSHIAVRWTNDVIPPQINAATHRDGFLATADVYAADDFP